MKRFLISIYIYICIYVEVHYTKIDKQGEEEDVGTSVNK
jgi:hypothetical protein